MNALVEQFGPSLVVLGFPCNQFGKQENVRDGEILSSLAHIRPGNGFKPNFPLMMKGDVNGEKEQEVFTWLKGALPVPVGEGSETLIGDPALIIWKPVKRNDISWNFEKFLVGKDGLPIQRYSKSFHTKEIAADIEAALKA